MNEYTELVITGLRQWFRTLRGTMIPNALKSIAINFMAV